MISIIAGKYKGRKLYDLKNLHVRPTQAKVRKSVFQILESFNGLEILDLRAKTQYFDIIFADPPYTEVSFHSIKNKINNILKPEGIFCMEMKKEPIDEENVRVKHYGSTQVVFWRVAA